MVHVANAIICSEERVAIWSRDRLLYQGAAWEHRVAENRSVPNFGTKTPRSDDSVGAESVHGFFCC